MVSKSSDEAHTRKIKMHDESFIYFYFFSCFKIFDLIFIRFSFEALQHFVSQCKEKKFLDEFSSLNASFYRSPLFFNLKQISFLPLRRRCFHIKSTSFLRHWKKIFKWKSSHALKTPGWRNITSSHWYSIFLRQEEVRQRSWWWIPSWEKSFVKDMSQANLHLWYVGWNENFYTVYWHMKFKWIFHSEKRAERFSSRFVVFTFFYFPFNRLQMEQKKSWALAINATR